jgi:hypothetical protein
MVPNHGLLLLAGAVVPVVLGVTVTVDAGWVIVVAAPGVVSVRVTVTVRGAVVRVVVRVWLTVTVTTLRAGGLVVVALAGATGSRMTLSTRDARPPPASTPNRSPIIRQATATEAPRATRCELTIALQLPCEGSIDTQTRVLRSGFRAAPRRPTMRQRQLAARVTR